jgi:hypothetical protein
VRRIALATLAHDGLRTAMLVLGLAAAWALVIVQLGLRRGFELSSRAIPDHVGGEVWLAAAGVKVVDDGEPIAAPGIDPTCAAPPRPVVVDYTQARRQDGSLATVQVVAVDAASRERVPWGVVTGDPAALEQPRTVAIDAGDAGKLGLTDAVPGARVRLRNGAELRVVAVTRDVTAFTQTPYLFVSLATAHELLGMEPGAATFWVLDDASCSPRELARHLRVVKRDDLARSTTSHWIDGSGIGALLAAGSLIAGAVGAAVFLQNVITMIRSHAAELATIRALGALRSELVQFVAWQVGTVALTATVLAQLGALALSRALRSSGLAVVVDARTWLVAIALAVASTALAALLSGRILTRLDPREVLE